MQPADFQCIELSGTRLNRRRLPSLCLLELGPICLCHRRHVLGAGDRLREAGRLVSTYFKLTEVPVTLSFVSPVFQPDYLALDVGAFDVIDLECTAPQVSGVSP